MLAALIRPPDGHVTNSAYHGMQDTTRRIYLCQRLQTGIILIMQTRGGASGSGMKRPHRRLLVTSRATIDHVVFC